MNKSFLWKNLRITAGISLLCIVISIVVGIIERSKISGNQFYAYIDLITSGFYYCQVAFIIGIAIYGWLLLVFFHIKIPKTERMLLSFPVGMAMYVVLAHILMLAGICYNAVSICVVLFVILLVGLIYYKDEKKQCISLVEFFSYILLMVGFACIASTGVFLIMMSADSYHFIAEFGWMLGKLGSYSINDMATMMTSTGLSPAIIVSIGTIFGFESTYGIHYMLIFCMVFYLAVSIFEIYKKKLCNYRSTVKNREIIMDYLILPLACLLSCGAFIVLCGWIISTSYWMVYNTLFVIIIRKHLFEEKNRSIVWVISLFALMLTITRSEAILFVGLVCVLMISYEATSKQLYSIFIPSVIVEIVFLGKILFIWKYVESSFMSFKNALIFLGFMIGVLVYVSVIKSASLKSRLIKYNQHIIMAGFLCATVFVVLYYGNQVETNFVMTFKNLGLNEWGMFPWIVLTLCIFFVISGRKLTFVGKVWISQALLALLMNGVRFVPLRFGIGDSYNRLLMSLIPIIVYSFVYSEMPQLIKKDALII